MRAVVTVSGTDRKGVVAQVSAFLADNGINIEDVSQTVLGGQFAMVMVVDIPESGKTLALLSEEARRLGEEIGMSIGLRHADIFTAMHNV